MKKIRIKKLPKANMGAEVRNQIPYIDNTASPNLGLGDIGSNPPVKVNSTLKPVPRSEANLEAEVGETAVTDLNSDGLPEFYKIGGKKHYKGGTPLNLPNNSFIYSNDKSLRIKDPILLKQFGKGGNKKKKGYTPAELSKTYDINKFRKVLADPNSDRLSIETAEKMIKNYMDKLGALALVQESMKGFDSGIPAISMPYLQKIGISSQDILPPPPEVMQQQAAQQMQPQTQMPAFNHGGPIMKRKVKINQLPLYNNGGGVASAESNKPTKRQNIPDDAKVFDADSPDFDPKKLTEGSYVKRNGKYYKVGKKKYAAYDGPDVESLDPKLKGKYGDLREAYGRLIKKFNTDSDVREAFLENFDKELANLKPGDGIYSQADIEKLKGLSDQQKIDYFLNGNKHHMMIAAQMGDVTDIENVGAWDKGGRDALGIPTNYKSAIGQAGLKPMSVDQTLGFQAGYIALQKMYDDPKVKDKLKNFRLPKTGVGDEGAAGSEFISKADGWEGNTTAGEMVLWAPDDYTFEETEVPFEEVEEEEKDDVEIKEQPQYDDNRYYIQDQRNIAGSLYDMATIKKRSPWQATPQMNLAQPNFADFRGAAGRLGSMAQAGAQQLSTFGTPQGFAAGFANIQRNLAQNIGQLQDQEYKTNIATANQFELANTDIKNKFGVLQAKLATDLYDKETVADQAYDNSRRAMRWNYINAKNQADKNLGMRQAMNFDTPNYYIDFLGKKRFRPGATVLEPSSTPTTASDQAVKRAANIKDQYPDMDWATAQRLATQGMPKASTTNTQAYNNQTGGYLPPGYGGGYPGFPLNTGRRRRNPQYRYMHGGSVPKKRCKVLRLPNK